jgi:nucleoside permease NupC
MKRVVSGLGLSVILAVAYLLPTSRRVERWRAVLWGIGQQIVLVLVVAWTVIGFAACSFAAKLIRRFLGLRALLAGTLASFVTACIAGMIL